MTKPDFLTGPLSWTRTPRVSQTLAEYGCAIEHEPSGTSWRLNDLALVACLIGTVALIFVFAP